MDKRVLIASTISMGMVAVWLAVFKPHTVNVAKPVVAAASFEKSASATEPPAKPATVAAPADAKVGKTPAAGSTDGKAADGKAADPKVAEPKAADFKLAQPNAAAAVAPPPAKPAQTEATLDVPGYYHAVFSNYGAAPVHWVLLNPQYKEDNPRKSNKLSEPIDLVRTNPPYMPALLTFPASSIDLRDDAVWTEEPRGADGALVYSWTSGDVRVEKRFQPMPNSYQLRLTITVENKGDKAVDFFPRMQFFTYHDPSVKSGGFLSRRVAQAEGLCLVDGKLKNENLEGLLKKSQPGQTWGRAVDETNNKIRWIGAGEQFFVMAGALKPANDGRRCEVFGDANGLIWSSLTLDKQVVAKHGKVEFQWALFMGPKLLSQLDAVTVGGEDAEMGKAVDYGWKEAVARPMLAVLKGIHAVVPNWGVAIIILTILLKALTWWPTQKSMKSMKAMASLKPELDKLKERYGDDKNGMNVAMMELYKKHGVNPLGGCLPVLIQMPIYIALYAMLGNAVELYRSGFVGWIRDLTAADPYYVLPVLTGVLMFVQQKTQPASPDPQQRTMMYIMPVMFTAFSIFLPAGLTIYILTNTVLTFVQQFIMNRGDKKPSQPSKPAKPARA